MDNTIEYTAGDTQMHVIDISPLTLIQPHRGKAAKASEIFEAACANPLPSPGHSVTLSGGQAIWFGHDSVLLSGVAPPADLATVASLTDMSDGWIACELTGGSADQVLARLVPIDLRPTAFPPGATARTMLGHMSVSITRTEAGLLILAFRSMTETLVEDLEHAMRRCA